MGSLWITWHVTVITGWWISGEGDGQVSIQSASDKKLEIYAFSIHGGKSWFEDLLHVDDIVIILVNTVLHHINCQVDTIDTIILTLRWTRFCNILTGRWTR